MSTAILEYYPVVLSTAHWAQTCILRIHTRVSMPTLKTCNQFSSIPAHSPALCQTKLYSGLRHRRTKTPLLCTTQSTTLSDTGHRTDVYYPTVLTFFCTHHISPSYLFINPSLLTLTSPFSIPHPLLARKLYLH